MLVAWRQRRQLICQLRSAAPPHLVVPPLKLSTIGSPDFPVAAAKIWNALLASVVSASSVNGSLIADATAQVPGFSLINFVVDGVQWTVSGRPKADVQQILQILPAAAVLQNRR